MSNEPFIRKLSKILNSLSEGSNEILDRYILYNWTEKLYIFRDFRASKSAANWRIGVRRKIAVPGNPGIQHIHLDAELMDFSKYWLVSTGIITV